MSFFSISSVVSWDALRAGQKGPKRSEEARASRATDSIMMVMMKKERKRIYFFFSSITRFFLFSFYNKPENEPGTRKKNVNEARDEEKNIEK
jgi:hypothetical protein